eukprot:scaffold4.g4885.t1
MAQGTAEREARGDALRVRANEAFKKKRYAEAIRLYTEAIQLQPEQAVVYANRGASHIKLKAWAAAEADCSAAIRLDSRHVKARTRRARARAELGDWQGALSDIAAAVELDASQAGGCSAGGAAEGLKELAQQARERLAAQQQQQTKQQQQQTKQQQQYEVVHERAGRHASEQAVGDWAEAENASPQLAAVRKRLAAQAAIRPSGLCPSVEEVQLGGLQAGALEAAAAEAEAAAAAAVSEDEAEAEEPEGPAQRVKGLHERAARELPSQPAAAVRTLNEALELCPDDAQLFGLRAAAQASACLLLASTQGQRAITDYTTALELLGGAGPAAASKQLTYSWLLGRGAAKELVADYQGADDDMKAALDSAQGAAEEDKAKAARRRLVQLRVDARRQQQQREAAQPVHRRAGAHGARRRGALRLVFASGATIKEVPEDETEKAGTAARHTQEGGLKVAAAARARGARLRQEQQQAAEQAARENDALRERNAYRATRRREVAQAAATAAAEAAAAAAAAAAEQQALGPTLRERTRIPVTEKVGQQGQQQEQQQGQQEQQEQQQPAVALADSAPHAPEGPAAEAAAPPVSALAEKEGPPAEEEVPPSVSAPAKEAAPPPVSVPAPAAAPDPAAERETLPGSSRAEVDGWKEQADGLHRAKRFAEAEALYRKYLERRPGDQRAWSNLAETCCQAGDYPAALRACDAADAAASGDAAGGDGGAGPQQVPPHKLHVRRAGALQGLGRLQDAQAELDRAEAAAAGDAGVLRLIAKRQRELVAALEARGQAPTPRVSVVRPAGAGGSPAPPLLPQVAQPAAEGAAAGAPQPAAEAGSAGSRGKEGEEEEAQRAAAEEQERHERRVRELADRQRPQAEHNLEMGRFYSKNQTWEGAAAEFEEAVGRYETLGERSKEACGNLALALVRLERWANAAATATKALAVDPGYTKARYRRGLSYWRQASGAAHELLRWRCGQPPMPSGELAAAVADLHVAAAEEPQDALIERAMHEAEADARRKGVDVDGLLAASAPVLAAARARRDAASGAAAAAGPALATKQAAATALL